MSEPQHDWKVGDDVAFYSPYARAPEAKVKIEKVYKTGHVVVRGRRFRVWGDTAHETGDGYSKAHIKKWTDAADADIRRHGKSIRARNVARWLERANVDAVPDEALRLMHEAMQLAEAKSK